MRHLRIAVVGALIIVSSATPAAATRARAPFRFGGMVELSGAPILGSAPDGGELLRFLPDAHFELGMLLRNTSDERVVVSNVRVLEPPRTLMRQIGTRFHPWNPPKCPPRASCPAYAFGMRPRAYRPKPFTVAPGKEVGVELDFVLGSCARIPSANPAPLSRVRVTFRRSDGTIGHRVLPLGGASLHLRMPKPNDCADPRSSLSVDGPQRYSSSDSWTIPGSIGDVCTIRNGTLDFVSRAYQTRTSRPYARNHSERITLHLRHFTGTGTYHRGAVALIVAKEKVFRSHKPILQVTKATTREVVARIQAGRLPSGTTRGIPFRISGTMRCRVVRR